MAEDGLGPGPEALHRHDEIALAHLVLSGDLDVTDSEMLAQQIDQALPGASVLVVDLSAVTYIDFTCLQAALDAQRGWPGSVVTVAVVTGGNPRAAALIKRSGLGNALSCYNTIADVLAIGGRHPPA